MSALNEWKAIAEHHKTQLVIAEQKMQEQTFEFKQKVIALETREPYKSKWKKVIENDLIHNVQRILEDCYDAFLNENEMGAEFVEKAKMKIGEIDSPAWQIFTLDVIEYLCQKRTYINEDGSIDNFEDTSGGCDEVIWYIAEDIILQGTVQASRNSFGLPHIIVLSIFAFDIGVLQSRKSNKAPRKRSSLLAY